MKKTICIFVVIIIICIIAVIFPKKNEDSAKLPNDVTITQYKLGTSEELKRIDINAENDINELSNYVKRLNPLTANQMADVGLTKEIEIKYSKDISIGIQLGEKNFCYYENKEQNVASLSIMPKGLYEWMEGKLK